MSSAYMDVGGRGVGPGDPCFVIAEAGVNHNGDADLAHRLIDVAAQAGADAVKFQTFRADRLVTISAVKADYQRKTTDADESQYDMLRRLELSEEAHHALFEHAASRGIRFLSTPFDEQCADFLDSLGVGAFKIPSGEITNLPLLAHVARKGKPLIVSVGMSTLGEIEAAVEAIEETGNDRFVLLQCVSAYPADPATVNLRALRTLRTAFGKPVGFSDHTEGDEVALAAVALGACVIEKHFTLDRSLPGPDHRASIEPDELAAMIRGIRKVESALGVGRKRRVESEANTALVARKSLVAACDIPAGTMLTEKMVAVRRPGTGLPIAMMPRVIGCVVGQAVPTGEPLTLEMLTCVRLAS